ncbi:hypothetical protein DFH08DRAFT_838389 [Mycena albidolilacea]|uniref:Uncharacterized protein n=1 Tax=Mycena albidolilacea TaxID=1033008 RepID=A0AAD7APP8_9AGAR|nr:hypothetical protein DFH08DRAFT_838389 [Mycena albidolilacea]
MSFLFTFKLPVPGLNPFSSPAQSPSEAPADFGYAEPPPVPSRSPPVRPNNINQRRPSPSPSPAAPLSRKRGWDPSLAEPSQSAATLASSSGYLDTPAKYREMADEFELEDMAASVDLPPPAKRRRGLAGSIVSTAVSAALIGTAVGLTVYRLWRNRGKEAEPEPEPDQQLPPPPYQKGEWTPVQQPQAIQITPPTPIITPRRRKVRPAASASAAKRHGGRLRPRIQPRTSSPPSSTMSPPRTPYGSNNMEDDDAAVVEDKMDWLGDQLSMLIQEGQKALGREIVVKSDAREDEVDDGCGVWEEDEGAFDAAEFGGPSSYKNSMSRSASPRQRKRPRNLTLAPPSYAVRPASESPRAARFEFASASLPASATRWRGDAPGNIRGASATREEEEAYESPELKESMARARARLLGMRGAG